MVASSSRLASDDGGDPGVGVEGVDEGDVGGSAPRRWSADPHAPAEVVGVA